MVRDRRCGHVGGGRAGPGPVICPAGRRRPGRPAGGLAGRARHPGPARHAPAAHPVGAPQRLRRPGRRCPPRRRRPGRAATRAGGCAPGRATGSWSAGRGGRHPDATRPGWSSPSAAPTGVGRPASRPLDRVAPRGPAARRPAPQRRPRAAAAPPSTPSGTCWPRRCQRRVCRRRRPQPVAGRGPMATRRGLVGAAGRRHLARHLLDCRVAPGRGQPGLPDALAAVRRTADGVGGHGARTRRAGPPGRSGPPGPPMWPTRSCAPGPASCRAPAASREAEGVCRREAELADGHAEYRFSGYVTVTAADREGLEAACVETEQAAQRAHLELRRSVRSPGGGVHLDPAAGAGAGLTGAPKR